MVDELALKRFNSTADARKTRPQDVLQAAIAACDAEDAPVHVIVLFGRVMEDGASGTRFMQGGNFAYHAQLGLLEEAKLMIRESGE